LHTDGTYKLNYQGYPVLIVGTTDMNKTFHPFGLMITQHERTEDYAYMFLCIKELVKLARHVDYEPTILVADCAGAITKGFEEVFNLIKRVFCWFHVKKAIEKEINQVKCRNLKNTILTDIVNFQHNVEENTFTTIARLMVTNWQQQSTSDEAIKQQVDNFIKYFTKQWLDPKRRGWYDHYCNHVPCHNNALESTNRYVKEGLIFFY
jgi:hypothetical protein